MREQCSAGAAAQRVCERDGSVESEPLRYVPTRRLPTSRSLPTARCLFRETSQDVFPPDGRPRGSQATGTEAIRGKSGQRRGKPPLRC